MFWSRGDAKCDLDEKAIYIPSIEWVSEYEPDLRPEKYWTLVLHEMAHYLAYEKHEEGGHGDTMYALLIALVMYLDLPLDILHTEETIYKPLSFRGGKRYAGTQILVNLMGK